MRRVAVTILLSAWAAACAIPTSMAFSGSPTGDSAGPAVPPSPSVPAEVDPTFCTSPGSALLPSLDGDWRLEGGDRIIWGATAQGSMTMRLGPQPDQDLRLEYLSDAGLMHMTNPNGDEEMYLFPATDEQVEAAGPLLGAAASRPGCDWYDSPLFIGTNFYYGNEGVHLEDVGQWRPSCTVLAMSGAPVDPESCHTRPSPEDADFQMEMTVVVRFSGSDHAAGMVYWEGALEDDDFGEDAAATISEFRARAPVEIVRK